MTICDHCREQPDAGAIRRITARFEIEGGRRSPSTATLDLCPDCREELILKVRQFVFAFGQALAEARP